MSVSTNQWHEQAVTTTLISDDGFGREVAHRPGVTSQLRRQLEENRMRSTQTVLVSASPRFLLTVGTP
ncbi:MAG TPA: hypothetical protein VLT15_02865 [Acidimicrobiia bacterium]|nr:hypothetical protein [Acidimicrobiia bacterium]